jgi:hypothetical protein
MTTPLTIEWNLVPGRGRKRNFSIPQDTSRVPRISRLMALAIRFEDLIKAGGIADYSELAQLGHVSRARITQIMNLLLLAPDIQEQVLFLPSTRHGRDPIHLARLQPIATTLVWSQQKRLWAALVGNLMDHYTQEESRPAHLSAGRTPMISEIPSPEGIRPQAGQGAGGVPSTNRRVPSGSSS